MRLPGEIDEVDGKELPSDFRLPRHDVAIMPRHHRTDVKTTEGNASDPQVKESKKPQTQESPTSRVLAGLDGGLIGHVPSTGPVDEERASTRPKTITVFGLADHSIGCVFVVKTAARYATPSVGTNRFFHFENALHWRIFIVRPIEHRERPAYSHRFVKHNKSVSYN